MYDALLPFEYEEGLLLKHVNIVKWLPNDKSTPRQRRIWQRWPFGLPAAVPEHGVGRSVALMTAFLVSYCPYPRAYAFASRRYLTEAIYILIT